MPPWRTQKNEKKPQLRAQAVELGLGVTAIGVRVRESSHGRDAADSRKFQSSPNMRSSINIPLETRPSKASVRARPDQHFYALVVSKNNILVKVSSY